MRSHSSRLNSRYQVTVPEAVRKILHLRAGDVVAFDIDVNKVSLRKVTLATPAFDEALQGTLDEWKSQADEEAYREL